MNNSNTSKAPGRFVSGPPPSASSSSSSQITSRTLLGVHLLIGISVFIICGLIATYTLAVTSGHVKELLCYISYTGDFPIESCLFSWVFSLSSLFYCIIIYLRFTQISHALEDQNLPKKMTDRMSICNVVSLLFGLTGAFGLNMTGCFQRRLLHVLHMLGVIFCTYFTYVYFVLQTYFSFRLVTLATSTFCKILRLTVVALSGCILLVAPFFPLYLMVAFDSQVHLASSKSRSKSDLFKVAAALEWTLFFMYQILLYSFYPDLKKIALKKDQILFLD